MSASRHAAQEYYMAIGSHTCSELTYMMAGTHVVQEYYMAVGSHACSEDASALSVIFSCYKCISICAKVAHIAYEPISAKIYLLATYSAMAQKYHVCYMHVGQHIFCLTLCVPAHIYAGALLVIPL